MIDLILNNETGVLKAARPIVLKSGVVVPVRVTLDVSPEEEPTFELTLASNATPPVVLAYTDAFEAQSDRVYLGTLDAGDDRLITYMEDKGQTIVLAELAWMIGGVQRAAGNINATVQPKLSNGPASGAGGPVYYTQSQVNTLIAEAVADLITDFPAVLAGLDLSALPTADPGDGKPWLNGGVLQVGA